ncbi:MAG: ParB/RepB/Spo0J family partition protein [Clostridiales bacterium]|jgi:ParB family chromosome partitioning protein|nr:ParB/RepB/Spo0J family partition protein [Clostridiales bacterium]
MVKRGLGKGLNALFSEETELSEKLQQTVNISELKPNKNQPRREFNDQSLRELAESIKKHGILQPLTVRRIDTGGYEIIAGERRWRAAREAQLEEVPVIIVDADDRKSAELALVENLQREDLNPIEEAQGFRTLIDEFELTQEELAARIGKSRSAVANSLRLLSLAGQVREMLFEEKLSVGHAKVLLALDDEKLQQETAAAVIKNDLSVRQTETVVKKLLQASKEKKRVIHEIKVNYLEEIERKLSEKLGRKVRLVSGRKKGRIELEFYGNDDLETLIGILDKAANR